jgi:hypothetical protein
LQQTEEIEVGKPISSPVAISLRNTSLASLREAAANCTSFVISHRMSLEEAPQAYKTFRDKQQHCIKVVLDPRDEMKAA